MIGFRPVLIALLLFAITGCEQNYSGDVGGASVRDNLDFGRFNPEGQRQYNAQCASCHGTEGNGTEIGTPLVACASCTGVSILAAEIASTMPIGRNANASDCEGQCATDVAEYVMYAFNGQALHDATTSLNGVAVKTLDDTLRSSMIQLAGRLPTSEESTQVQNGGETAFASVMNTAMAEPEFHNRLNEIFNDVFLTDKYLAVNQFNGALNLLDSDDYPQRFWFDTDYPNTDPSDSNTDNRNCARTLTNDAIAREGIELINYLAANDLPVTGLVTAEYIMVNWYSQKVYEAELIDPQATFRTLDSNPCTVLNTNYASATLRHDPADFRPARITKQLEYATGIPHAGILTSAMFLNRFTTTDTNRNRHRSYHVYDIFLDTDILKIEGARPEDSIDTTSANPTLDNPACFTCHTVMDPIASAFQHWTSNGRRIPSNHQSGANRWSSNGIESPGLAGSKLPLSGADGAFDHMLQWLGQEISEDPRFIRAITRHLYRGLVGEDILQAPGEEASADEISAFNAQRGILSKIGQAMVAADWDIKTAINGILLSPYYRASTVDSATLPVAEHIGSSRLLTPEMLQRKLRAIFGFDWYELRENDQDNRIMFGGIDSDSVTSRISEPNGLMIAMQERMAIEMACRSTAFDFTKTRNATTNERRLFRSVSLNTEPSDADGVEISSAVSAIKENIRYLHYALLGENLSEDDPEITATYQVFLNTWQTGNQLLANPGDYDPQPSSTLSYHCRGQWDRENNDENLPNDIRIIQDPDYTVRAWIAVLTYLLSDYRFIYE